MSRVNKVDYLETTPVFLSRVFVLCVTMISVGSKMACSIVGRCQKGGVGLSFECIFAFSVNSTFINLTIGAHSVSEFNYAHSGMIFALFSLEVNKKLGEGNPHCGRDV